MTTVLEFIESRSEEQIAAATAHDLESIKDIYDLDQLIEQSAGFPDQLRKLSILHDMASDLTAQILEDLVGDEPEPKWPADLWYEKLTALGLEGIAKLTEEEANSLYDEYPAGLRARQSQNMEKNLKDCR